MTVDINRFIMQIKQALEAFRIRIAFRSIVRQDEMIVLPPWWKRIVGE